MNQSHELDRIVRELNSRPDAKLDDLSDAAVLDRWLAMLVGKGGSDLLLVPGAPVCMLADGSVRTLGDNSLKGPEIEGIVLPALTAHALRQYREKMIADSSYKIAGVGRFRINLHSERGQAAASVRALPTAVPLLADLHLAPAVESLSQLRRGLVLIGGPAGCGKSTTLAALIHEINRRDARHILTIEDPIEYEHPHIRSIVEQVEIGTDAPDFPTALRAALRQAPDVIVIGEMRDTETMQIAVAAAETGHLVLSTIHATDIASAVSRISDSFPEERQNAIRQELAMALSAVVIQILLPCKTGGRMPASELLMMSYGARQHIRHNTMQHLQQEITISRKKGSFTLEESLAKLVTQGHIDRETALTCSIHPDDLEIFLKGEARAARP